MYAIGGSANPTINSQGNRYIAPPDPNAKEVIGDSFLNDCHVACRSKLISDNLILSNFLKYKKPFGRLDYEEEYYVMCMNFSYTFFLG